MADARANQTGIVAALLPKSLAKRTKAVYAAMDAMSRQHAAGLAEILLRECDSEKRLGKLEIEANLRIGPALAPWLVEDPQREFLSYYSRHLRGRIHGAGIPNDAAQAVVRLVEGYVQAAVECELRRGSNAVPR